MIVFAAKVSVRKIVVGVLAVGLVLVGAAALLPKTAEADTAVSVSLPVKRPYAITLYGRLPIVLRAPLEASVTILEATTPVKLPTKQCPRTTS